jgi:hypothetical protein
MIDLRFVIFCEPAVYESRANQPQTIQGHKKPQNRMLVTWGLMGWFGLHIRRLLPNSAGKPQVIFQVFSLTLCVPAICCRMFGAFTF